MKRAGLRQPQLLGDIVLHQRSRGGGQGDHRRGTQRGQVLPEHAVVGAEIVSPLGNAVGFVDGDQAGLALGQHLGEAGNAQAFGRDEQKLQGAVQIVDAGLARRRAVAAGMDALHREAALAAVWPPGPP